MAVRFRRTKKLMPGVRLNVGKKSAGLTVGGKLFRTTVNTKGQATVSGSVPGTGVSWIKQSKPHQADQKSSPEDLPEDERPKSALPMLALVMSLGVMGCALIVLLIMAATDWIDPSNLKPAILALIFSALVALLSSHFCFADNN